MIVIGILVVVQSQKTGTHTHILHQNIYQYVGNAQITPQLSENYLFYKDFLVKEKTLFAKNTLFAPRIMQWVWGNAKNMQKPMQILAISQALEHTFNSIFKEIRFKNEKNAVLGNNFKAKGIKIGDTLWLKTQEKQDFVITQDFFDFPNPTLNENTLIIPLETAQNLFNAQNQCSFLLVKNEFSQDFSAISTQKIKKQLKNKANFQTWQETMPDIAQFLWLDKVGFGVLMVILCFVLALGLYGSVMVLAQTREMEFLQLHDLGVNRLFMLKWVCLEWFLLGIFGILGGILCCLPFLYHLSQKAIMLKGELANSLREMGFSAEIHFAYNAEILLFPVLMMFFLIFFLGGLLAKKVYFAKS